MKTEWLNVASVNRYHDLDAATLQRLAQTTGEVVIFSTVQGRNVGHAVRYEWRPPEDLWAECRLDDDAELSLARAAAIIVAPVGQPTAIVAVFVTRLSPPAIAQLTQQWNVKHGGPG
jgi:hypothetical protein